MNVCTVFNPSILMMNNSWTSICIIVYTAGWSGINIVYTAGWSGINIVYTVGWSGINIVTLY